MIWAACLVPILFLWLVIPEPEKRRTPLGWLLGKRRGQDNDNLEAVEAVVMEPLAELRPPQLEEETRLQEVAHQLCIALVQHLVRAPRVR